MDAVGSTRMMNMSSTLQILSTAQFLITENWPEEATIQGGETFDFIIVGAGSAGCIVANRLSENPQWSVLLIEAGPNPPILSIVPVLASLLYSSKYDWDYSTVPNDEISQGRNNGAVYDYRAGKMLGGGSSINGMFYFKGIDRIYQRWYDLGNKEWHPSVTRQYSKKAEILRSPRLLADVEARNNYGLNGPLAINQFNFTTKEESLFQDIMSGFAEIGIQPVLDLNNEEQLGVSTCTVTADGGQRESTATSYLNPYQDRPNLKILRNTIVTKVLIDNDTKRAYGVEISRKHKRNVQQVYANLEVIVCAGALRTPQLLMLSGIGPREVVEQYNITSVVDLKGVGRNFHDHVAVLWPIFGDKPIDQTKPFDAIRYLFDRTGRVARDITDDLISFFPVQNVSYPQIESNLLIFEKGSIIAPFVFYAFKPSIMKSVAANSIDHATYVFSMQNVDTFSEGYVTINSSNAEDPPVIYPNILGDPRDLENLALGCLKLTELVNTTFFRSINGYVGRLKFEPCDSFGVYTLEYWRCIVKSTADTCWHATGTAKMGISVDDGAVVTSRLKVYGVEGLRVIDASVMPTTPSCNTNGPTIMVAERGSDLVKEDFLFI